ncbi:hypothetical protein AALP_AA3G126600 [Arabis alpina]|uniref:Uncharacterized protein n=1 Tax=Arabis alpina TaxID=50452 RepID=A0A087H8T3_ARAAL|nr:hypothetical protein AALP_AA3G126600 [Arabis alpina]
MSRCSNVNKMEHLNQNLGNDLLRSCSSSFCLKAAYIWSDLHYQSIKGHLSAIAMELEMCHGDGGLIRDIK